MKISHFKLFAAIVIIFLSNSNSFAGIKYFQNNKVNKNGSVSISITYSAPTQDAAKSNNLIGNFPFTDKLIKEYFTFPGAVLTKAISYKDPTDPNRTGVTVEFNGGNLINLSSCKALSGIKSSVLKKDTGYVISWFVPSDYYKSNQIDIYQFNLTSEPAIKSTNGLNQGNEIKWYVFTNKVSTDGSYFVTTVKSEDIKEGPNTTEKKPEGVKDEEKKGTGCGLFGIELPILFLGGMFFLHNSKRLKDLN